MINEENRLKSIRIAKKMLEIYDLLKEVSLQEDISIAQLVGLLELMKLEFIRGSNKFAESEEAKKIFPDEDLK